jgi:hypothetical protein
VTEPRVLRPSRKRQAIRIGLGLWIGAFGVGGLLWGAWPLALVTLAIAAWLFAMAALVAFRPRSYELRLDDRGFRVHDMFGKVAHDVSWDEVVDLIPVNVNAFSFIGVAWVCAPRRAKQGRLRWRRGTEHDDGCLPDTYGMRADRLIGLMREHAAADQFSRALAASAERWNSSSIGSMPR